MTRPCLFCADAEAEDFNPGYVVRVTTNADGPSLREWVECKPCKGRGWVEMVASFGRKR